MLTNIKSIAKIKKEKKKIQLTEYRYLFLILWLPRKTKEYLQTALCRKFSDFVTEKLRS